jgi:hypothetical protein
MTFELPVEFISRLRLGVNPALKDQAIAASEHWLTHVIKVVRGHPNGFPDFAWGHHAHDC